MTDAKIGSLSKILGIGVRKRMTELSLSKRDVVDKTGLPRILIDQIERGCGNPTLEEVIVLADALDIEIVTLLNGGKQSVKSAVIRF